jgi:hypothetical protein
VIEVGAGMGKLYLWLKKLSIIISKDDLDYSKDFNAIKIPLKYFLLI